MKQLAYALIGLIIFVGGTSILTSCSSEDPKEDKALQEYKEFIKDTSTKSNITKLEHKTTTPVIVTPEDTLIVIWNVNGMDTLKYQDAVDSLLKENLER